MKDKDDKSIKVMLLCSNGWSSHVVASHLRKDFDLSAIVVESSQSPLKLLKNRATKIGKVKAFGQLCFMLFVRLANFFISRDINDLKERLGVECESFPEFCQIEHVQTINSPATLTQISNIKPEVIVVNGTRIISKEILEQIDAPIINTHAGITPQYRGVHGGYWAIAQGDPANCGVTVHLVDSGIDTGGVLYQQRIAVDKRDGFLTYPVKQLAAALPLLTKAVRDAHQGELKVVERKGEPSNLWFHPTFIEYIQCWLRKGVK